MLPNEYAASVQVASPVNHIRLYPEAMESPATKIIGGEGVTPVHAGYHSDSQPFTSTARTWRPYRVSGRTAS